MTEQVTITKDDVGTITLDDVLLGEKPKPVSKHVAKRLAEQAETRIVDMGGNATIGPKSQQKS